MSATPSEEQTTSDQQEEMSEQDLPSLARSAGGTDDTDVTLRDLRFEIIMALGVVLFGLLLIVFSWDLRQGAIPDPVTTRGMPIGAGAMIMAFGGVVAYRDIKAWRKGQRVVPSDGGDDERGFPAAPLRVGAFVLGSLLWAYLLPRLSYPLTTPIFLSAALRGLDVRSWQKLVIVPIVFTAVSWFLFAEVLGIRLPLGIFEAWARSMGLVV